MILSKGLYNSYSYFRVFFKSTINLLFLFFKLVFSLWPGRGKSGAGGTSQKTTNLIIPSLKVTKKGRLRCISCGLCLKYCPCHCIKMDAGEAFEVNTPPDIFEIDLLKCIGCGYCEEVCPVDAIVMRDAQVFDLQYREEFLVSQIFLAFRKDLEGNKGIVSKVEDDQRIPIEVEWLR
ncbi:MAG: 4Fe-4S dicluster domain-containing protein [Bacteriovoracaceae bacterium]|nr:4Fe-4S dicluster domain-containing protein [Bacteriovoracaceae bacterium]